MMAPARRAAFDALRRVNEGKDDLSSALVRTRLALPDQRDRALAAEIVTGTLRWQGALDHVIALASGRALERFDSEVLDILRLGAYQLLHLSRVPPRAVVNDAVALTRVARKRSASGLVNAVLRKVSATRDSPPLPRRPAGAAPARDEALAYLSLTWSHPRWLVARWLDRLGFDAAEARVRFNNAPAPVTLRVNTLRTDAASLAAALQDEGVTVVPARYAPDALVVTAGHPLRTPLAGRGLFAIQDEASQLVTALTDVAPGMRVLDACASPGGKTTALAAAMRDQGLVVALDVRDARVHLLRETVREMGTSCVRIVQADAARGVPLQAVFERALVDAPCSGLGIIRRDPEIRWRRAETDLARLAEVQKRLLFQVAASVAPGALIVYATCSSEPEENDDVVCAVAAACPALQIVDARTMPRAPHVHPVIDDRGFLRTTPERHGLDAFFAAVLRRSA